jgi:hypothetical protein
MGGKYKTSSLVLPINKKSRQFVTPAVRNIVAVFIEWK